MVFTVTMTDIYFAQLDALLSPAVEDEPNIDVNCKLCKTYMDDSDVCTTCGWCVPHSMIHEGAEWRGGISEDGAVSDPSRVGMAADKLYSENWGLTSIINTNGRTNPNFRLAARINFHQSMNHKDRALYKAYTELDGVGQKLGLSSSIINDAKHMYKSMAADTLTRGAVRSGVKANCLFQACKKNNVPRTTGEIASAFGITTKDISRTHEKVVGVIKPKKNTIIKPADMVVRIFGAMDMEQTRELSVMKCRAKSVAADVTECPALMGKTPAAVAAAVIYKTLLGTDFETTKESVAAAASISVTTLNKIDAIVRKYLKE